MADTHALAERLPRSLEASGGAASQDMLTFERWLILLKVSTRDLLGWCCFRGCDMAWSAWVVLLEGRRHPQCLSMM